MKLSNAVLILLLSISIAMAPDLKGQDPRVIAMEHKLSYQGLMEAYGEEPVLAGVYFLTDCLNPYREAISAEGPCALAQTIKKNAVDSFGTKKIEGCLSDTDYVLIDRWCKMEKRLHDVDITSDAPVSFESVVYNMPEGKSFFRPYLTDTAQYYGSLDFQQSCALYYDVLTYLSKANPEEADAFLEKYYRQYKEEQTEIK